MSGDHEEEIRIALEEGVLTPQEADSLREEARRLGRSPLDLLRERWLSEETLALLQQQASDPERRPANLEEAAPREQVEDRQARSPVQVSPLDETATIAPVGASPPPVTPPLGEGAQGSAFPVPGRDRYQHVGFLGQGGMGRKGLLLREKDGLAWRYSPALGRTEFEKTLADGLATEILHAHGEVALSAFVDAAAEVDESLLDRLNQLIAQRRKGHK